MHKNRDEISNTAAIIKIALENATRTKLGTKYLSFPSIFLDRRVLDDPPFALFHEIIKFVANAKPSFNWESLFLTLDCSCKQKQQLFLLRLLALVSRVNGVHYDVFLSPATLLHSKMEAQTLLQALATSTMVSEEVMSAAVSYVLGEGDAAIYRKGVRTRNAISVLQLACRGWIGRRRHRKALVSSIDALLARKSKIEEDIEEAEARLQEENRKLMRILQLKDTHRRRTSQDITQPLHDSRPKSAPLPNNPRKPAPYPPQDEKFADSIIDISDLQSRMKRKERALFERERKLKERHVKAKDKEAELKLDEERISELSHKIRKQQMQMKEQKLQLERSKALSVTSIPEPATNSQPCSVCIERKHHMRRARAKFKQQVRLLHSMEKELTKREMLLAKREAASQKEHHKKLDTTSYTPKSTTYPPKTRKRIIHHEDNTTDSSHEVTEQCMVEDDEDVEISLEEGPEEESEQLLSEKEETTTRHSQSKQTPITRNIPKMTTTSPRKNASKHRKQRQKDETSQSNLPQPTYHKHIFTFEKNHQGDDELDYADAQLRCAVKSIRELI